METVSVYTFENIIEESRLRAALEEEGIEVMVRSFEDSAYDGIYTLQKGKGEIRVLSKDAEKSKRIIAECRSQINMKKPEEEK